MNNQQASDPSIQDYESQLKQEGAFWGEVAQNAADTVSPEWRFVRQEPQLAIFQARYIDQMLAMIRPGWRVLEIGCSSGWLSYEMARLGAQVDGIDIAESAIAVAQEYARQNPPEKGSVHYQVADVNHEPLEANHYDLIVALGVLHHLAEVEAVMERVRSALKPTGIFFVRDVLDTPRPNALIAGALFMLLPTQMGYVEKFRHLFRLRGAAASHMVASIEAKGLSPFEGYGRPQQGDQVIKRMFKINRIVYESAFVGYITAQLNLPKRVLISFGRMLATVDRLLVRTHLLQGLNYIIWASLEIPDHYEVITHSGSSQR